MVEFIDVFLLILLAVTGLIIINQRNLFAAVMMAGIYSLLTAGLFVVMDAVDVAFTEAAVGAGISTVLMLGTLALVGHEGKEPEHKPLLPLFVVAITGGILVYGTVDLPPFGDPANPIHHHVADHYIHESESEISMEIMGEAQDINMKGKGTSPLEGTTVAFSMEAGRDEPDHPPTTLTM